VPPLPAMVTDGWTGVRPSVLYISADAGKRGHHVTWLSSTEQRLSAAARLGLIARAELRDGPVTYAATRVTLSTLSVATSRSPKRCGPAVLQWGPARGEARSLPYPARKVSRKERRHARGERREARGVMPLLHARGMRGARAADT
jgi:hypothetical protein